MKAIKISYYKSGKKTSTTLHPLIARYWINSYIKKENVNHWNINTNSQWLTRNGGRNIYCGGKEIFEEDKGWLWGDDQLQKVMLYALQQAKYITDDSNKESIELMMMGYINNKS